MNSETRTKIGEQAATLMKFQPPDQAAEVYNADDPFTFTFAPKRDVTGYEVLLMLPIVLNANNPAIHEELVNLLNQHPECRRHWIRSAVVLGG